jgi:hypothetical protein
MYEGFSGQARKAVQVAHQEAERLRHDYLGTEHLVLGVLREGSEGVVRLLAAVGTDPEKAYREVEAQLSPGEGGVSWDRLPLTPGAKRALNHAREEAANLHHLCVGPEHLLLGALGEPDSSAAQLLLPLGLGRDGLRNEMAKLPEPENRDWMLRPPPTAGLAALGDPSVRDLQTVVTEEVLPRRTGKRFRRRRKGSRRVPWMSEDGSCIPTTHSWTSPGSRRSCGSCRLSSPAPPGSSSVPREASTGRWAVRSWDWGRGWFFWPPGIPTSAWSRV